MSEQSAADVHSSEAFARPRRVRRLDPRVVSKISAGEMILRPLSVVKELVENALDADARSIEVSLGDTPDQLIQVSDDGVGMSRDDLLLALEAHATSKLEREADLLAIRTMGFRGEAIPSIGRVARLEIVSSDGETGEATRILVDGGHLTAAEPASRPRGTTVRVEDLFFNSPVRKRFLKSPHGEERWITRFLAAIALAHPDRAFRLIQRGAVALDLPIASTAAERLVQLHGPSMLPKLLPIQAESSRGRITGWVGVPELARPSSQQQVLLVNRRWVSTPWLGTALRQGFADLIPANRSPFAIVLLEIEPSRLDVNVHPTKREVRFLDESGLVADLTRAVRAQTARLLPTWNLERGESGGSLGPARSESPSDPVTDRLLPLFFGAGLESGERNLSGLPSRTPSETLAGASLHHEFSADGSFREGAALLREGEAGSDASLGAANVGGTGSEATERLSSSGLISVLQLHQRYLLAQTRQGLLIIDQHAAHERVLYEQAWDALESEPLPAQQLLFPVVVHVNPEEWEAFREVDAELSRLGILAEEFGQDTILLRGAPAAWTRDPEGFFREVLQELARKATRGTEERWRRLAAGFACRSAVKSGQVLTLDEMNALIDRLFATRVPHGDPHGRPTFIQVPLADLDRRFGRSH